jgi:ubiquinone/menaquinone biosynthesis C-methylase UbiE
LSNSDSVTPERIYQLAWGYVPPLVLEAAIHHRVFDVLESGSKTLEEIQKETGASKRGLSAIVDVLVGLNFLEKDALGKFSLTTESSMFLVSFKPSFQGGMIRHCSEDLIPKWLKLNEIVGTGKPCRAVNQVEAGSEFFEKFVTDIFPMSYPSAQVLARHLQVNESSNEIRILDLAAGSGVWGIALAQNSERVRVTAVDWPEVISVTRKTVGRFGLSDRFSFVPGDLLNVKFGTAYNLAILGHILHSEGQDRSQALLAKTFDALAPGGTIAIAEFLVNSDRTGPLNALLFAVNMLVNTENGNTYSFEEIASWLLQAGFANPRTLESPGPSPLILATKP